MSRGALRCIDRTSVSAVCVCHLLRDTFKMTTQPRTWQLFFDQLLLPFRHSLSFVRNLFSCLTGTLSGFTKIFDEDFCLMKRLCSELMLFVSTVSPQRLRVARNWFTLLPCHVFLSSARTCTPDGIARERVAAKDMAVLALMKGFWFLTESKSSILPGSELWTHCRRSIATCSSCAT